MPDPNLAALLAQMSGGGVGGTADAKTQLLMRLMEQRAASDETAAEDDDAARRRARARRRLRLERDALAFLQQKNQELAAALGACVCWGDRPGCPQCRGQGRPGWQPPDEELFLDYLEPVLHRLGLLIDEDDRRARPS